MPRSDVDQRHYIDNTEILLTTLPGLFELTLSFLTGILGDIGTIESSVAWKLNQNCR